LRVVTALERSYARFDGLNLTWETLEGVVKHNGPLTDRMGGPVGRYRSRGLPHAIRVHAASQDLELWSQPSAEAQIAALADDIAYDAHDIDDGLRAGLFGVDDLAEVDLISGILCDVRGAYGALEAPRMAHELVRRLIARLIEDVAAQAGARLRALAPQQVADVRTAGEGVVAFSDGVAAADRSIKAFLNRHMYRHDRIVRIMGEAEGVIADLFARYVAAPQDMPLEWTSSNVGGEADPQMRRIGDFIAGMTDRYALIEHARLFKVTPELRYADT
jgi:dGTPase